LKNKILLLFFVRGGGRIVFGFKNKDLKVTELPSSTVTLTPPNYADIGFTWIDTRSLIDALKILDVHTIN
jgi:hypothetical protein